MRNLALWAIILILLVMLFQLFQGSAQNARIEQIGYSEFVQDLSQGEVATVVKKGDKLTGKYTTESRFRPIPAVMKRR